MAVDVLTTIYNAKDGVSSVFDKIGRKGNALRRGITADFAKMGRSFDSTTRKLQGINRQFSKLDGFVGIAGGLSIAAGASLGATAFLDLDKNMSAASAKFGIFDRNSEKFIKLRGIVTDLGGTTEYTSGQVADAFSNMGAAGFNFEQSLSGIKTVLDLATASQSDLSESALIAGKTLGAFGMKSDDPKVMAENLIEVSNVLNKLKTGKEFTSLDEIRTAVTASGSSAKLAGQDISTWASAIGSVIGPIGDASVAGTGLNMMFTKLANPTNEGGKLLKKYGVVVSDEAGNFRDFVDIVGDLEAGMKGLGSKERLASLSTIFDSRAAKTVSVLIDKGANSLRAYREEIRMSGGITSEMARFMRSGLSGGVDAMKSGFEAIAISLGDVFQPEIDNSIKRITDVAKGSKQWIIDNKDTIKTVVLLTGELIPFILGLKVLIGVMGMVNAVMMMNPFFLVVGAVAALAFGVYQLYKNWDKFKESSRDMFSSDNVFVKFLGAVNLAIEGLVASFQKVFDVFNTFKEEGFLRGLYDLGQLPFNLLIEPVLRSGADVDDFFSKTQYKGKTTRYTAVNDQDETLSGFRESLGIVDLSKARADAISESIQTTQNSLDINVNGNATIDNADSLPAAIRIKQMSTTAN